MKPDILTLAVLVFCVGVLVSSIGLTDAFQSEPTPPAALQQGIATR